MCRTTLRLAAAMLALAGCTRTFTRLEPPPAMVVDNNLPPTGLVYAADPLLLDRGVLMTPAAPTVTGGAPSSFVTEPALPDGLSLDHETGIITGTAQASQKTQQSYRITAANGFGAVATDLRISVRDAPPLGLTYAPNPDVFIRGTPIIPVTPTLAGGLTLAFSVSPPLPLGLALDPQTGVVSGTPSAISHAADYTIVASNEYGQSSATWTVQVIDVAPKVTFARLKYYAVLGVVFDSGAPALSGGAVTACAWADPSLDATGLHINATTCALQGIAVPGPPLLPGPYGLIVAYDGGTTTASIDFVINDTLSITPPSVTAPAAAKLQVKFSGQGGAPPYVYSLQGSGQIDAISGVLSLGSLALPTSVRVTDTTGLSVDAPVQYVSTFADNIVNAATIVPPSDLYVGGAFRRVNYLPVGGAAAFNSNDGGLDLTFDTGTGFGPAPQIILATLVTTDAVFYGGAFSSYNGHLASKIVKVSLSGTYDPVFNAVLAFGAADTVQALAADATGLYVAGTLTSYRGQPLTSTLVKLDLVSGALITSFDCGLFTRGSGPPVNAQVQALLAAGGSVYAAGFFDSHAKSAPVATSVAKLDPTTCQDQWDTALGSGVVLDVGALIAVRALAIDGASLYAGGDFQTCNPATSPSVCKRLARLQLPSGALDASYHGGPNSVVSVMAAAPGGGLYLGGQFSFFNATPTPASLVKLDAAGAPIAMFLAAHTASGSAGPAMIHLIAPTASAVYVAGSLVRYDTFGLDQIVALDPSNGAAIPAFHKNAGVTVVNAGPGAGSIQSGALAGGRLLVAGLFSSAGGAARHGLVKLDAITRRVDDTFDPQLAFSAGGSLPALYSLLGIGNGPGAGLYVGGYFSQYQGVAENALARLSLSDASLDQTCGAPGLVPTGFAGVASTVFALAANNALLFASGSFSSYRSGAANSVAALALADCSLNGGWVADAKLSGATLLSMAVGSNVAYVGGNQVGGISALNFTGTVQPTYSTALNAFGGSLGALLFDTTTPNSQNLLYAALAPAGAQFKSAGTSSSAHRIQDKQGGAATFGTVDYQVQGFARALGLASGVLYVGGALAPTGSTVAYLLAFDQTTVSGGPLPGFSVFQNAGPVGVNAVAAGAGVLFAGGQFSMFGTTPVSNAVFLDPLSGVPIP